MNEKIVEQAGTHLLIARGDRFVIVERRNNRLYNCHGGKRDGIAADNLAAIEEIVDETDWVNETAARRAFNEVVSRGTELSERMR
ncbi:MAG: hypothetical protein JO320_18855 [Alphaproteobacteria bacterium]|nr:hypothetical protein [Acetobacteraceae bacterium]MBV9377081.1 hypothetical protein [Alphaproteobacteria bacterium]